MFEYIQTINQTANRNVGKLFLIGILAVVGYNARQWRRDQALAGRLRDGRTPPPTLNTMPMVSALVAAWNEADTIDAHIQSFLALRYPNIELVLCAGGTDATLTQARLQASERVIVLEQRPGEGKQKALARCYERAGGDVIYLTDADCRFDDEALVRLLAPIVNQGEQVATGQSRPLDRQMKQLLPGYVWAADVVSGAHTGRYVSGLLGRNAALMRPALDQAGGLDFEARTGTDYQLAQRLLKASLSIRYAADSIVQSEYPVRVGEYQRKQSRWLRNLLLHGRRYGAGHDVQVTMKTVGTGAAMLAMPFGALWFGPAVLALWALLVVHATGAKLRYSLFAAELHNLFLSKRLLAMLVPLTLLDFAIWASPIVDLIDPRRREQW